ncbi:MAG: SDR family oxidoreductase [Deltaproteobacteria bacterium]|nr:SDR family oxidoreductase [Deltaproteobacteria bacterium]
MMRTIEEQGSAEYPEDVRAALLAKVPLAREGTNEELAALPLFLASRESAYCTGTSFVADGGDVTW